MKATKEEAEKAWIDWANAYFNKYRFDSSKAMQSNSLDAIEAYKSALRADIEKDLSTVKESDSNYIVFKSFADKFLGLLETTLPTTNEKEIFIYCKTQQHRGN